MGRSFLVDSNVLIDLFKGRFSESAERTLTTLLNEGAYYLSAITKIELLGFDTPDTDQMNFLQEAIGNGVVLPIDDPVINTTISLRKKRKVKLPDAIIAATALVHHLTLLSRNTRDFGRVEMLEHLDPHEL
jgi:predicted nucleic acid-binding protein